MKQRLLIVFLSAVTVATGWALWARACDENKQTSAQASVAGHDGCTAEMAAKCTPEMAAACAAHKAKMTTASMAECPHGAKMSTASMTGCTGHGANATTASMEGCAGHGANATTASMEGCAGHKANATTASMEGCAGHKANATTASMEGCAGHGAKATTASAAGCEHGAKATTVSACGMYGTATVSSECSAHMKASAAGSSCAGHGAKATTAGSSCRSDGMLTTADASMHPDCDACADMVSCAQQLTSSGAQTQVLPLKNGVMFVYTTDTPGRVRAVQSAMSRRSQRLVALAASGDRAKLCPECKSVRGAIASGKLTRETVNIEGGCLTLMTSTDPAMVAKLRGMAGTQMARAKI